ncbi:M12 family metallo-peptidase [Neptunicella sp. SCSIO 80796]|uniref:M12 family metallo-peptidase n=1 Tax=Neptunicella plasticusilytica TaxID=3117012 RepID=UPI003A4DA43F
MKNTLQLLATIIAFMYSLSASSALLNPIHAAKGNTISINEQVLQHSARHQLVRYDSSFLFLAAKGQIGQPHVAAQLQFDLFDAEIVNAEVDNYFTRQDGKIVWQGKIIGEPLSTVNLIANKGQLTGNIRHKGKVFQLRTQSSGYILISEFSPPAKTGTDVLNPDDVRDKPQAKSGADVSQQNLELPLYSENNDGFTTSADVSVLVYYTRQALELVPDLLDVIDLEFMDTNQAFDNSDINASVSIVAKIEVDELTIEYGQDIYELANKTGPFANIDSIRAKYQADLVHMYVDRLEGICGRAWYAAYPDGGTDKYYSYGTTAAQCTGSLVTAHELGHNFGAAHDRYVENGGSADTSNYGYVDLENEFKTVMSYDNECNDHNPYKFCDTITHFSNPEIRFNDYPTGKSEPLTESSNNAAQLNFSGLTLANFYGVSAPVITSISQGEQTNSIDLSWTTVENATGYRVQRRIADVDGINGPLCSYPVYGDEFVVSGAFFHDTNVTAETIYCYSVTALNAQLLDNISSPESLVRSGYASPNPEWALPLINNIQIKQGQQNFQKTLSLPAGFDYQIAVVEYSGMAPPIVAMNSETSERYTIELSDIPAENQTVTLALSATEQATNHKTVQQFTLFITGYENRPPTLNVPAEIELDQQSSTLVPVSIVDDQNVSVEGIYVYSKNLALIEQLKVSANDDGELNLHIAHERLNIGQTEVVIGYTDGEYSVEKTIQVNVKRSVYNPTQTQNEVVWYVKPGESITRLLPFYDIDDGETLTVTMVDEPQHGSLAWPLFDKVTYTAHSSFQSDSFSFYVIGEDGLHSEVANVIIKQFSEAPKVTIKQKVVSDRFRTAFLSQDGELFVWGSNSYLGLGIDPSVQEFVYQPTPFDKKEWLDIAFSRDIIAIKQDGTLWFAGYDPVTQKQILEFRQIGTSDDWRTVSSYGDRGHELTPVVLTKSDGSVWGWGNNFHDSLTNRKEFLPGEGMPIQLQPLYGVQEVLTDGAATVAITQNNKLFSWGSNYYSNLGRNQLSGYIAEIPLEGHKSGLQITSFRSALLVDGQIFGWGTYPGVVFDGAPDEKVYEPILLEADNWKSMAMDEWHFAGVKKDGSLWTMGGKYVPSALGRGMNATPNLTQVGNKYSWIEVWSNEIATFALDKEGNIWVTGGEYDLPVSFGLGGDRIGPIYTFEKIDGISAGTIDINDFDRDGITDDADTDDDNDSVLDEADAFPLDPYESVDTDGDGIGNNTDTDDDNDGVSDSEDAFPLDPSKSSNNVSLPPSPPRSGSPNPGGGSMNYLILLMLLCKLGHCYKIKTFFSVSKEY